MNFKEYLNANILLEGNEVRIQHAEDLIFWEGAAGAKRAIESLEAMAGNGIKKTSVKWDGSPAVIFGRDERGEFILTDKSGFYAKGYDGKAKSPDELREMFLNRSGGKNRENPSYVEFANKMAEIFYVFKNATLKNLKGYFKGDLLYFSKPKVENDHYIFQPNVVKYAIPVNSDLGKRIGRSDVGVVVHSFTTLDGKEYSPKDLNIFKGEDLFVIPPVYVDSKAEVDLKQIKQLKTKINQNNLAINDFLDSNTLRTKQISDLPAVFYKYLNSKVDTGLETLGEDFFDWLSNEKLSIRKKENITNHIRENFNIFRTMWSIVTEIMDIKDDIISQFDATSGVVKQSMQDEPGGEGYVYSHKQGPIKYVPRRTFSRINRSIER